MVPGLNHFLWDFVSAVAKRGRYALRITSRSVQSWPLASEAVSDLVWSREDDRPYMHWQAACRTRGWLSLNLGVTKTNLAGGQ
jgi:hypothetical protein